MPTATVPRPAPSVDGRRSVDPRLVCFNPLQVAGFSALDRLAAFASLTFTPDVPCQQAVLVSDLMDALSEVAEDDFSLASLPAREAVQVLSELPSRLIGRVEAVDLVLDTLAAALG